MRRTSDGRIEQGHGGKGVVAILAGNQNAPNLQKRALGVRNGAKAFGGIRIKDTYYHRETPQDAAPKVEQVMQANPDITGWAFIGGWPLFTDKAVKWPPGTVKAVSVDALPPMLQYLRSGHVQTLLAHYVYEWGWQSVALLLDRIYFAKAPATGHVVSPLVPVTKGNVDTFAKDWEKWLPR